MEFQRIFRRSKPVGTYPALGSDSIPTGLPAEADNEHILRVPIAARDGVAAKRIDVAYRYAGAGPAPVCTGALYLHEGSTDDWFHFGDATLTDGEIVSVSIPNEISVDASRGARLEPLEVAIVVADPGGAAGEYLFAASLSPSDSPQTVAIPVGWATQVTLAAIQGQLPASLGAKAASASLSTALATTTNVHSPAHEKSRVLSAAPARLRSCIAHNKSVAPLWLMLFDAIVLPANGTVPDRAPVQVAAGDTDRFPLDGGSSFAAGIVAALSSTAATLTIIVADDAFFDAELEA